LRVAVIYNRYFKSIIYNESINIYVRGLQKSGLDAFKVSSSELITKTSFDFDYAVLLDKDVSLGYILEKNHIRVFNSSDAVRICDSKILTYIKLMDSDILMPKTTILPFKFSNMEYSDYEFENVITNYPVIIKEEFGSLGQQINLIYNKEDFHTAVLKSSSRLMVQEYIECDGSDIRVFVVGNNAVCAMKRHNEKDFRSNCAGGSSALPYPLNDRLCEIAQKSSKLIGLDFCGVDIIEKDNKYYLIEVNSNPLVNNLSEVCNIEPGYDIGKLMQNHLKTQVWHSTKKHIKTLVQ